MTDWDLPRLVQETWVASVDYQPEVASTNTLALSQAAQVHELPRLFLAERQTAGRGRGGNPWWSSAGAITCSLLLEPDPLLLPVSKWPLMSLGMGVAVCQTLQRVLHQAPQALISQVKWPNDVYVNQRKICGILVETVPQTDLTTAPRVVVGIGINVNNSFVDAPTELTQTATALCDLLGQTVDRTQLMIQLLQEIEHQLRLLARSPAELIQLCRALCWLTGKRVTLQDGPRQTHGLCLGINDDGALLVQTNTNTQKIYGGSVTVQP